MRYRSYRRYKRYRRRGYYYRYRWRRPVYWNPVIDECSLCGRSLYGVKRYKIIIYNNDIELFRVYVCEECKQKVWEWARGKGYKTKTRSMPMLENRLPANFMV